MIGSWSPSALLPPGHVEVGGTRRGVVQVIHEHVASLGPVEPVPTLTANVPTASGKKMYVTPSSRVELLLGSTRDQN